MRTAGPEPGGKEWSALTGLGERDATLVPRVVYAAVIALDTEERASLLLALSPLRRAQQSERRKNKPEKSECELSFHDDHLSYSVPPGLAGDREK
jgi:hypothetical protein